VAPEVKTTCLPSAEISARSLRPVAEVPSVARLISVVVPVTRSRTKTSALPLSSPETRLLAIEWNATRLPSAEIDGHMLVELPEPPVVLTLTSSVVPALRSRT